MLTRPLASAHTPWPVREPKPPTDAALMELFTLAGGLPVWACRNAEELWKKTGLPYRIEVSSISAATPRWASRTRRRRRSS